MASKLPNSILVNSSLKTRNISSKENTFNNVTNSPFIKKRMTTKKVSFNDFDRENFSLSSKSKVNTSKLSIQKKINRNINSNRSIKKHGRQINNGNNIDSPRKNKIFRGIANMFSAKNSSIIKNMGNKSNISNLSIRDCTSNLRNSSTIANVSMRKRKKDVYGSDVKDSKRITFEINRNPTRKAKKKLNQSCWELCKNIQNFLHAIKMETEREGIIEKKNEGAGNLGSVINKLGYGSRKSSQNGLFFGRGLNNESKLNNSICKRRMSSISIGKRKSCYYDKRSMFSEKASKYLKKNDMLNISNNNKSSIFFLSSDEQQINNVKTKKIKSKFEPHNFISPLSTEHNTFKYCKTLPLPQSKNNKRTFEFFEDKKNDNKNSKENNENKTALQTKERRVSIGKDRTNLPRNSISREPIFRVKFEGKFRNLTRREPLFDSMDESESESGRENESSLFINPEKEWVIAFDFTIFFCALYAGWTFPLRASFSDRILVSDRVNLDLIFNAFIDLIFVVDFFMGFLRGYLNYRYVIIRDKWKIVFHYLKSWFILDLLGAMPFVCIIFTSSKIRSTSIDREEARKFYFFFLKPVKVFKALNSQNNRFIFNLEKKAEENEKIESAFNSIKTMIIIIFIFHFLISLFIFIGLGNYDSWIYKKGFADHPLKDKYIIVSYFLLYTFTTVGYGDVNILSKNEVLFTTVILTVGVIGYTWVVSNVGNYFRNQSYVSIRYSRDLAILQSLKVEYPNLPFKLFNKISQHLLQKNLHEKKKDKNLLINDLPYGLKTTLIFSMYRTVIARFKFFRETANSDFITKVLTNFISVKAKRGNILIREGDRIDGILFVKEGRAALEFAVDEDRPRTSLSRFFKPEFFPLSPNDAEILWGENNEANSISFDKKRRKNAGNYSIVAKALDRIIGQDAERTVCNNFENNNLFGATEMYNQESRRLEDGSDSRNNEEDEVYVKVLDFRQNEHYGSALMFLNKPSPLSLAVKSKTISIFILGIANVSKLSKTYSHIWRRINKKEYKNLVKIKEKTISLVRKCAKFYGVELEGKNFDMDDSSDGGSFVSNFSFKKGNKKNEKLFNSEIIKEISNGQDDSTGKGLGYPENLKKLMAAIGRNIRPKKNFRTFILNQSLGCKKGEGLLNCRKILENKKKTNVNNLKFTVGPSSLNNLFHLRKTKFKKDNNNINKMIKKGENEDSIDINSKARLCMDDNDYNDNNYFTPNKKEKKFDEFSLRLSPIMNRKKEANKIITFKLDDHSNSISDDDIDNSTGKSGVNANNFTNRIKQIVHQKSNCSNKLPKKNKSNKQNRNYPDTIESLPENLRNKLIQKFNLDREKNKYGYKKESTYNSNFINFDVYDEDYKNKSNLCVKKPETCISNKSYSDGSTLVVDERRRIICEYLMTENNNINKENIDIIRRRNLNGDTKKTYKINTTDNTDPFELNGRKKITDINEENDVKKEESKYDSDTEEIEEENNDKVDENFEFNEIIATKNNDEYTNNKRSSFLGSLSYDSALSGCFQMEDLIKNLDKNKKENYNTSESFSASLSNKDINNICKKKVVHMNKDNN